MHDRVEERDARGVAVHDGDEDQQRGRRDQGRDQDFLEAIEDAEEHGESLSRWRMMWAKRPGDQPAASAGRAFSAAAELLGLIVERAILSSPLVIAPLPERTGTGEIRNAACRSTRMRHVDDTRAYDGSCRCPCPIRPNCCAAHRSFRFSPSSASAMR